MSAPFAENQPLPQAVHPGAADAKLKYVMPVKSHRPEVSETLPFVICAQTPDEAKVFTLDVCVVTEEAVPADHVGALVLPADLKTWPALPFASRVATPEAPP